MLTCDQCGARYPDEDRSCGKRFEFLLALDHSRAEPWGSRHALAFGAFVLQHPRDYHRRVLEGAWGILWAVYVEGHELPWVLSTVRTTGKPPEPHTIPSLPELAPTSFPVTICDLGDFDGNRYPDGLDRWCRATLDAWQKAEPAGP